MRPWLRPIARAALASYVGAESTASSVAFTFDDGPDPACTPLVLDALRAHGAHATFFVLAERASAHPDLVRRAIADGHEVALHGFDHTGMLDLSTASRFRSLLRGRTVLRDATGSTPRWFRAPYGRQSPGTVITSRILGMRPVMWSAYAREWEDLALDDCVDFATRGLRSGSILLLHDSFAGDGDGARRDPEEVARLVDRLLGIARARELRVVTVSELVANGSPRRAMWFREWRVDAA